MPTNTQPQEMEATAPETAPATPSATVPEQEPQAASENAAAATTESTTPEAEPHQEAPADSKFYNNK